MLPYSRCKEFFFFFYHYFVTSEFTLSVVRQVDKGMGEGDPT